MISKLTLNFAIEHQEPLNIKSGQLNRKLDLVTPLGLTFPEADEFESTIKKLLGDKALGIKPYGMTHKGGRTCSIRRIE